MATANQLRRQQASNRKMAKRGYSIFSEPLYPPDDTEAILRSPQDTMRRAMILWQLGCAADGTDRGEIRDSVEICGLVSHLSPTESVYLACSKCDPQTEIDMKWRLEASWVLLWVLRKLWWLNSPDTLCDCVRMANILAPIETEVLLNGSFHLRSKSKLLDMLDLTLRQHWAVRDDCLRGVHRIPGVVGRVVYQRHYALNWLTSTTDWDEITTDT
jgi:hypothetical protein